MSKNTISVFEAILDFLDPSRKVIRNARRLESERKARVKAYDDAWRAAHPELVAQGCPPPPTRESLTQIGVMSYGVFYVP